MIEEAKNNSDSFSKYELVTSQLGETLGLLYWGDGRCEFNSSSCQ